MTSAAQRITWQERSHGLALLRPRIEDPPGSGTYVSVDPTVGTWQLMLKPYDRDGADDDSSALLTLTTVANGNGSLLTVIDDPEDAGTDIWQVDIYPDDMPAPGSYRVRLDRTTTPVARWLTVLDVEDR